MTDSEDGAADTEVGEERLVGVMMHPSGSLTNFEGTDAETKAALAGKTPVPAGERCEVRILSHFPPEVGKLWGHGVPKFCITFTEWADHDESNTNRLATTLLMLGSKEDPQELDRSIIY